MLTWSTIALCHTRVLLPALTTRILQVQPLLAGRCMQLVVSSGQAGDWDASLGALRLGRLLGCTAAYVDAGDMQQLQQLRVAAHADNGTAAHLFTEQLGKLLPVAAG